MQSVELFVLFLVQTHFCWGQYTMVTPSPVVMVPVGSDVTLPCQVEPAADLREQVVEWARQDLTPRYVHIRRDGLDLLLNQNSMYLGRTALSESQLQKGDLSLSLSQVKLSDGGTYRCFMPRTHTEAQVTMLVVSVASPLISVEKDTSGSVVLRCESVGCYPEPELQWLDSQGTVVLRTEAQRGTDDLFSVSSSLTVQEAQGNTFTCRVQHQPSGESREVQFHITDEILKMESSTACSLAWTLFVLCLIAAAAAAAAALVVWKFKANKQNKDIELGKREEKEGMLKTPTENTQKCSDVLQPSDSTKRSPELREREKIEDELKYLDGFIQNLRETKTFLTELKKQPQEALYRMNSVIDAQKNRKVVLFRTKEIEEEKKKNIDKLQIVKTICEKTIEDLEKRIASTEEMIIMSEKRKSVMEAEHKNMTKFMGKEKKQQESPENVNDEGNTQDQNEAEQKPEQESPQNVNDEGNTQDQNEAEQKPEQESPQNVNDEGNTQDQNEAEQKKKQEEVD